MHVVRVVASAGQGTALVQAGVGGGRKGFMDSILPLGGAAQGW